MTTTDRDYLRQVQMEALTGRVWTLRTWDTHTRDNRGQTRIAYELIHPDGVVIFAGSNFSASPMHADDSDDALRCLLGFLTLKPGDTDAEYFADYTEAQREFSETYECDAMGMWSLEPEEGEPSPEFVNIDGWDEN